MRCVITSYSIHYTKLYESIDLSIEANRQLETIIPAKELVIDNYRNLPSNYINTSYVTNKETTNSDYKIISNNDIAKAIVYS